MGDDGKKESSRQDRFKPDEVIASQRNKQLGIITGLIVLLAIPIALTVSLKEDPGQLEKIRLVGEVDGEPAISKEDIDGIQIWKGTEGEKFTLNRDGDTWVVPTRFNAPADETDVDSLVQRVFDAYRFNRPATTDQAQYVYYRLTDDEAAHLRMVDEDGNELLHILLGKSETGSRDFIRLGGEGAPEGIFELTSAGGALDTIYSSLALDADGEPQPTRWLDLSRFQPLPYRAVTQRLSLKDGEHLLEFSRKQGSDTAEDEWVMTSPHAGEAEGSNVRSLIDALMNYSAQDVAGKPTQALRNADRQVIIEYELDGATQTSHLYFGESKDGKLSVLLESAKAGEFVYQTGDFMLDRLFRPTSDFLKKVRLRFLPENVDVERFSISDEGTLIELVREETESALLGWKAVAPFEEEADYNEVSGLMRALSGLQGYRLEGEQDREALGVGKGISRYWVTISYPEAPEEDNDGDENGDSSEVEGDEGEDQPGDEQPGEEQPGEEQPGEEQPTEEPPAEPESEPLKTATLYFGNTVDGEMNVMLVKDGSEEIFRVPADAFSNVFRLPGLYIETDDVDLLQPGQSIEEIRITDGDSFLHLLHEDVVEGGGKRWQMKAPEEEQADQGQVNQLNGVLQNLRGVPRPDGLDKEALGLGDTATRFIDLRVQQGEESKLMTLRFGEKVYGLTSLLVVRPDGSESFFLLRPREVWTLLEDPGSYRYLDPFEVKVRHILISWKYKTTGLTPSDPGRTEAQARELANEIMERARGGEDFVELQKQYNEDGDATAVYDVSPGANLVPSFKRLASELEVDGVGVVESVFGLHVMKRIE